MEKLGYKKISLEDIEVATESFDINRRLGSGGYGEVYKAQLKMKSKDEDHDTPNNVAIKRIKSRSDGEDVKGFLAELDVASKCKHHNIVSLLGICVEEDEKLLIYELASNGSLEGYLGSIDRKINLTWTQCLKLCIDIAQGLKYMHTTMKDKKKIIHRDIKSANILLSENWEAKIADFGFSKIQEGDQGVSTISTFTCAGTEYYLDPEYAMTGVLKKASDIYSLGVVLFEIFSGKLAYNTNYTMKNEKGLASIARKHFKKGTLKDLLDPKITDEANELGFIGKLEPDHDSLHAFSRIAYQCVAKTQVARPTIEVLIEELENALHLQENRIKPLEVPLADIRLGVEDFSGDHYIVTGGYGTLYKGEVQYNNRCKKVVVKRFSHDHLNNTRLSWEHAFLKEFEVLFKYKQWNIIGLVGYCNEMEEKIIVFEHASKGSLDRYLNDYSVSWTKRLNICIDIANGLKFLHGGGDLGQDVVIHRDIKSSNILLNKDWKAKICGFEHAITYPPNEEIEYVIDNVEGSPGCSDPLFLETHFLTKESDIYSFGVLLFEIFCGRLACPEDFKDHSQFLDVFVKDHFQEARLEDIVFEGVKEQIGHDSVAIFGRIAFQCLLDARKERPTAGEVVVQLQKALKFQEVYEKQKAYEIQEAKFHRNDKNLLQFSNSPESSARAKTEIYNIISKGILLENDKLEIIRALQHTTLDIKQEEDDYD